MKNDTMPGRASTARTVIRSPGALVLGGLFAAVTAYVLLVDVVHGAAVTTGHVLSAAALVAAIAAGHMAWPTIRRGAVIPGVMLAVLSVAATGYVIVSAGARNAETLDNKAAATTETNSERDRIKRKLALAEGMLGDAQKAMAAECRSGAGQRCKGIRATIDTYTAAIVGHQTALGKLEPPKDASGGYAHVAKVLAAIPGISTKPEAIEDRLTLILPFITALICELATLAFLAAALGHADLPIAAQAPVDPKPRSRRGATKKDEKIVAFVETYRRRHGRNPSLPEMRARFPDLSHTSCQRYRTAMAESARPMPALRLAVA